MLARDYFEGARACQRAIDARLAVLDSMRARETVRAQRYGIAHGKGGVSDPMHAVDERIDAEGAARAELARMEREVEDARALCRGIRAANPCQRWADALELRYIEDLTWRVVAGAMGVTERQAQAEACAGMEWVDSVGIARARSGMGQAALL